MRYLVSFILAVAVFIGVSNVDNRAFAAGKGNLMLMELKSGTVKIKLREDLAPDHVARIKQLVEEGF